jgi:hypothetical protein
MKICFTTALFGDPKTLDKPAKFERNPDYDYFLFTDINKNILILHGTSSISKIILIFPI